MKSLKEALNYFVTRVTKSVGICTTVSGIFFYHVVFDKDLECTCKDQTSVCWSYMILPVSIIFFMLLWLDGSSLLKYTCWKCIFRAFLISLLWPISVLLDGDWFICCWHDDNVYCRNQKAGDKMIKITSRVIGFGALLGIIVVAGCLWSKPWKEDCTRCESNKSKCLSKDVLFRKTVLEGSETLVTNKLIEAVKGEMDERINEYVSAGEWWKCYDVVEEIIDAHSLKPLLDVAAGEMEEGSDVEKKPIVQSGSSSNDDVVEERNDHSPSDKLLSEPSSNTTPP